MSNDTTTTGLLVGTEAPDVSASGWWSESYVRRPEMPSKLGKLGQIAGVALAIAVSPVTAIPDIWSLQGRGYDVSTAVWGIEVAVGRQISRAEALRITRQVLERAERERMELAEWEAKRGIQWEEGA